MGEIQKWLSFSVHEIANGFLLARALVIFKREGDLEGAEAISRDALSLKIIWQAGNGPQQIMPRSRTWHAIPIRHCWRKGDFHLKPTLQFVRGSRV